MAIMVDIDDVLDIIDKCKKNEHEYSNHSIKMNDGNAQYMAERKNIESHVISGMDTVWRALYDRFVKNP